MFCENKECKIAYLHLILSQNTKSRNYFVSFA